MGIIPIAILLSIWKVSRLPNIVSKCYESFITFILSCMQLEQIICWWFNWWIKFFILLVHDSPLPFSNLAYLIFPIVVNSYMSHPRTKHWNAIKWILRYLRGKSNICLNFRGLYYWFTRLCWHRFGGRSWYQVEFYRICIYYWWVSVELDFSI